MVKYRYKIVIKTLLESVYTFIQNFIYVMITLVLQINSLYEGRFT
jgi:hypothetical protein